MPLTSYCSADTRCMTPVRNVGDVCEKCQERINRESKPAYIVKRTNWFSWLKPKPKGSHKKGKR